MTLFFALLSAAAIFHGIAAWNSYRYYRSAEIPFDGLAIRWVKAAFCLQLWFLVGMWLSQGSSPLATGTGILTVLSFCLALALLTGRFKAAVPVLTAFFQPLIFLLSLLAAVSGWGLSVSSAGHWMTAGTSLHIFLTFLGFAHFTLGFGVGTAFWIQEGQLKQHRLKSWSYRLPALEVLDQLTVFYTGTGFLFWTGGFALGAAQAVEVWGHFPFTDPKILGSLFVLLIYSFFFLLRWGLKMRGRKTMVLVMAGYFLALFTFVGVRVFLTTRHVF